MVSSSWRATSTPAVSLLPSKSIGQLASLARWGSRGVRYAWAYLSSMCQSLISTPAVQYLILMMCCSLFRWTVTSSRKCIAGWEMAQFMAIWFIWGWGESLADEWAPLGGDLAHWQYVLAHFGKRKGFWRYHCNILGLCKRNTFY